MGDGHRPQWNDHLVLAFEQGRKTQSIPRIGDPKPSADVLADDPWARAETQKFEQGNYHLVEVQRRRQVLSLRKTWSNWLIAWITFQLLFEVGLTLAIGADWLSFEKHPYFLGSVVAQVFFQVLGMGLLIVKFLYPQQRSEN